MRLLFRFGVRSPGSCMSRNHTTYRQTTPKCIQASQSTCETTSDIFCQEGSPSSSSRSTSPNRSYSCQNTTQWFPSISLPREDIPLSSFTNLLNSCSTISGVFQCVLSLCIGVAVPFSLTPTEVYFLRGFLRISNALVLILVFFFVYSVCVMWIVIL